MINYSATLSRLSIYGFAFGYTIRLPLNSVLSQKARTLIAEVLHDCIDHSLTEIVAVVSPLPMMTLHDKLFPLLPSQPWCDFIQATVALELPEHLRAYGICMAKTMRPTVTHLHLAARICAELAGDLRTIAQLRGKWPHAPLGRLLTNAGVVCESSDWQNTDSAPEQHSTRIVSRAMWWHAVLPQAA